MLSLVSYLFPTLICLYSRNNIYKNKDNQTILILKFEIFKKYAIIEWHFDNSLKRFISVI